MHAYRAILRGADVPESWHEAIIWLMPKGTATSNLDEYRPMALGQQDMRMLMTPLMRRFEAVLARKGLAADWQFGAMPGCTAAAPVFLAQRMLQREQEENHVLAFGVSKGVQHGAASGAGAPPAPHGGPGGAHHALPHPQLRVCGAHRQRAWPHAEHPTPWGPEAGQCGECRALPPPLGTPLEEPCLQGTARCSPCYAAIGASLL